MNEIKHIVFDLGQVLIAYDMEAPYRELVPDEAARRKFFDDVNIHDWNLEQDRGRDWREAEDALIADFPHHEPLIRAFRARWWDMIPGAIDDNVAIVDELIDRGLDVTALTNWAPDTFVEARRKFPILSRFRGITVSGDVGLIKPDVAIYDRHVRDFNLTPGNTLFFDDNKTNIEGARAAGWNAELYVSTDTLRSDLRRYRLTA